MTFNISPALRQLSPPAETWQTWYVAYSGGLDSTVLLHCLWQLNFPVHAVHVNHQLQPPADTWAEHCAAQCRRWGIPFTLKKIAVPHPKGVSLEAAARQARYAVFQQILTPNTLLCTAHHQADQAETVLLQLLRGSGLAGMAAMPICRTLGQGVLFRPLLDVAYAELKDYALNNQLRWVDDPSNLQDTFDRNYLRKHVLPVLQQRWPAATKTLARSARHCAEAAQLLNEYGTVNYQAVCVGRELQISKLMVLSLALQRQVIRIWLAQLQLPGPSATQLYEVQANLLNSRNDAHSLVHWPGVNIRRYRGRLYAQAAQQPVVLTNVVLPWDLSHPLTLPGQLGTLTAQLVLGQGIRATSLAQTALTVRFRSGGERCQPATRQHSQTLKNLFQEYAVPPWQRDAVPLLYSDRSLVAAIGQWICAGYSATSHEMGWVIYLS